MGEQDRDPRATECPPHVSRKASAREFRKMWAKQIPGPLMSPTRQPVLCRSCCTGRAVPALVPEGPKSRPGGPCPGPGLAPLQTQPAVPRRAPQARLPAARPPAAPPPRSRAPASALHSAHRTVLLMRAAHVLSPRLPRQVPLGTSLVPGLPAASAETPAGSALLPCLLRWAVSSEAAAEPTAIIWPQPMATGGGCLAGQSISDCRKQARPPRAGV